MMMLAWKTGEPELKVNRSILFLATVQCRRGKHELWPITCTLQQKKKLCRSKDNNMQYDGIGRMEVSVRVWFN